MVAGSLYGLGNSFLLDQEDSFPFEFKKCDASTVSPEQ